MKSDCNFELMKKLVSPTLLEFLFSLLFLGWNCKLILFPLKLLLKRFIKATPAPEVAYVVDLLPIKNENRSKAEAFFNFWMSVVSGWLFLCEVVCWSFHETASPLVTFFAQLLARSRIGVHVKTPSSVHVFCTFKINQLELGFFLSSFVLSEMLAPSIAP